MADNTVLNSGSGGDTIRDVLKGPVKTPVCILDVGGAGAESLLAAGQSAMAASLPVAIASNQSAVPVSLSPQTSGGLSVGRVVSAASTNATSVKGSAGQVYGYAVFNTNAAWRYLKIYDKASAPVPGTDTPLLTIGVPPGGGANMAFPNGVQCSAGIALALTAGIADNDTGAVGAGDLAVNLTYK